MTREILYAKQSITIGDGYISRVSTFGDTMIETISCEGGEYLYRNWFSDPCNIRDSELQATIDRFQSTGKLWS